MLNIGRRGFLLGLGALGVSWFVPKLADSVHAGAANVIYLSFDDGYVGTYAKAAALNALGVTGTFFLTGQAISWHTSDVEFAVNSGHRLANHTYDHKDLTKLSVGQVQTEIQRCEAIAQSLLGVSTAPLLHAPYLAENATVRSAAAQVGFTCIHTDWDTNDWAGSSASYIASQIQPGVVTMHTQGRNTVAALESIVPQLISQGYTFGVLS
jgi:peptidoglycan/xylan/chitin deacetylase (PgdA/CDA1 family)